MKGADDKRIVLTKEDEKVDIMTKDDNQVSAELAFSADFQESEGRHQSRTKVHSTASGLPLYDGKHSCHTHTLSKI